eukprot:CAMPEP_0194704084 /NCGR_PEP_ID=MMETSP0295-20121207/28039_1 /TAXON_ID=39354 /ORGANISM="Heterosigma akashiwo, Strain CCMP2393" /LENGTH=135 /DNA_ID=CAMNT_0039599335 /DNA_START=646 /DNA_END=1049 /DNA_ORIENTATION=+
MSVLTAPGRAAPLPALGGRCGWLGPFVISLIMDMTDLDCSFFSSGFCCSSSVSSSSCIGLTTSASSRPASARRAASCSCSAARSARAAARASLPSSAAPAHWAAASRSSLSYLPLEAAPPGLRQVHQFDVATAAT